MKEIWVWIQAALAAVGGFLGWFLGGWDGFQSLSSAPAHYRLSERCGGEI